MFDELTSRLVAKQRSVCFKSAFAEAIVFVHKSACLKSGGDGYRLFFIQVGKQCDGGILTRSNRGKL